MKRRKPCWRRLGAAASFFWLVSLVPAQAPPGGEIPAAVWDAAASLPPPAWFGPVHSAAGAGMTVWRASIRPPPGQSRLAVTLVFDETQGGFARLIWQGPARALTVCGNLYEGAAPLHARTLLLDRETLAGPGQLVVEATGTRPVLIRAELSWVEPLVLAASGWTPPGLYLSPSGRVIPVDELHGQGPRAPVDEQRGRIIDAVLDTGPVKIRPDAPVRFVAPISTAPSYARIEARIAGLGPGEEPTLWVNGRPAAAVAVDLPSLDDAGYRWLPGSAGPVYGGWRKVTVHVPPGWLAPGENHLDWQCPPGSAGMTIRHLRLQVSYDRAAPVPSVPPIASPPSRAVTAVPPAPPSWSAPRASAPQLRLGLSSRSGGLNLRSE
jgi:hypothetical protein